MLEIIGFSLGTGLVVALSGYIWHTKVLKTIKHENNLYVDKCIKEALQKSRNVVRGQVAEELLPLFPDFPYVLSDCKFIGRPIDYIVFEGMSDKRDTKEGEITIVLADVKVNKSTRNPVQNAIKRAVEAGRIRFETWQVVDGNITKM